MTRLKDARMAAGMTQKALADAAGLSFRVLQNYEQGTRRIDGANIRTLLDICAALRCSLADVIEDPGTRESLAKYEEAKERKA